MADEQMAGAKDKRGWISLKADALGKAGRASEGAALLAEALTERPGDPGLLNELCWLRGTREIQLDIALQDCTRAIARTDYAATGLASAAVGYLRHGRPGEGRHAPAAGPKLRPGLAA